jgi:hypothetical protein
VKHTIAFSSISNQPEIDNRNSTLDKIVSGGQTGVDRAALDAAQVAGLPTGGWCPRGRRAEDGRIPARYPLRETPSRTYAERTARNVRDSDATLVLSFNEPAGGTALTIREAGERGKPFRCVRLGNREPDVGAVLRWLHDGDVRVLNVAGPRASEAPGIYEAARSFLREVFR